MWSSEVMLRINSSVSSSFSGGPSTLCNTPCSRITGGTPTRKCRSDAPSATTNCSKSDMEYDINQSPPARLPAPKQAAASGVSLLCFDSTKPFSSFQITQSRADDLFWGSQPCQHLSGAVLAQRAHAHLAGAGAQLGGRHLVVNQFPDLVIHHEDLKNSKAPAVTGFIAVVASFALHERGTGGVVGIDVQGAQFGFGRHIRSATTPANAADQPLGHQGADRGSDQERFDADVDETGHRAGGVVGVQGGEDQVP